MENEQFEASDLSAVKQLLKSLDLKVMDGEEMDEVSHQAFYNTFNRPDKEGRFNEENRIETTRKTLFELIRKGQKVVVYWDSGQGNTLLQIMVNGKDWSHPQSHIFEEVLREELIKSMKLPHDSDLNHSKGQGQLFLNITKNIVLKSSSEETYQVSETLSEEDLWQTPNETQNIHRFFSNTLPFAQQFKGIRRGFHAATHQKSSADLDFFFVPTLQLSTEEMSSFSALLLEKVNAMTLQRHDYDFSKIEYQPTLEVNGQINDEHIAILSLEVSYMVFEKRTRNVVLFEEKKKS